MGFNSGFKGLITNIGLSDVTVYDSLDQIH